MKLDQVLEQLRRIDDLSVDGTGMSPEFLEIEKAESDGGEELRINGNRQGLIHFARLVLEVAEKDYEGSHQHLDEHGNVDRCDMPVVIVLKKYVWDIDRAG